jgi:hypothetical protein
MATRSGPPTGRAGRPGGPARGRVARALPAIVAGFILLLTLHPTGGDPEPWTTCLICGSRGTADAVMNVLLFLPLGAALLAGGAGVAAAALLAFSLSLGIEVIQMGVPGRDPSFGDLFFNSVGGLLGALAAASAGRWLAPRRPVAAALSAAAAAGLLLAVAATGTLLRPAYPWNPYFGQWTPELGHLHPYDGRVLEARVAGVPVGPHVVAEFDAVRDGLRGGGPVEVVAVAGTPPPRLASIFSIYSSRREEIVLIGPRGDDLVHREFTRASYLRLDNPERRAAGLMEGVAPGDTVRLRAERTGAGVCLALDDREVCDVGFTPGAGWMLFYDRTGWGERPRALLGAAWLLALAFPFGFWSRRHPWSGLAAAGLAAGVLLVPWRVGLLPFTPLELAGVAAGIGAGAALARLLRQRDAGGGEGGEAGDGRARGERVHQLV